MLVRVHIPLARNAIPYYEYLKKNYRSLCSAGTDLEFYVYSIEGQLPVDAHKQIVCKTSSGSTGHAIALTVLLQEPVTEDIKVIADSDTVMLEHDWDLVLNTVFKQFERSVVGTSYEPIGGFSSGNSRVQTYKNRATMSWIAIPRALTHVFTSFDTSAEKQENLVISTIEQSHTYNLPIGYELLRDACWSLPQFLDTNNIHDIVLRHAKPSKDALAVKSDNDYNEEYQLNGIPFVGHQRGSMKHPFRGNEISKNFYDSIESYL